MTDDSLKHIPIEAIDAEALARDRAVLEPEALAELQNAIIANGVRSPIEVFELAEPEGEVAYGLISGYRRLSVVRALHGTARDKARWATVPAFVRAPASVAEALAAMVEENAVRADLSPFEQGRIAVTARDQGVFPTIEEAVERLYPSANAQKRSRLRSLARLAEEIEGLMTAPEALSQAQALRLAAAFRAGFGPVIRAALEGAGLTDPESQWAALVPVMEEAEKVERAAPAGSRLGRPRRVLTLRNGLTIRREMTRDGYLLRFTGREATSPLLDAVLDNIELMFSPAR